MAYIDLTPITISTVGTSSWSQLYNVVEADDVYTICPSANVNPLYIEFYPGGSDNPLVPTDSIITGIEVFYSARTSGVAAGNSYLDFYLYNTNTRTQIGSALRSTVLTSTEASSSVGSSKPSGKTD